MTNTLEDSIGSMQNCVSIVRDTSLKLRSRAQTPEETERIKKVLQLTRKYEEVTQSEVLAAQQRQAAEIAPQVQDLIDGVEKQISSMHSKERKLKSQSELNKSRLEQFPMTRREVVDVSREPEHVAEVTDDQLRELEELQQEREKLKMEISRLNLEKRKSVYGKLPQ